MVIVTLDFATTEPDTALRLLHADTARVRGLPGNLAFDVLRDTASPDRMSSSNAGQTPPALTDTAKRTA